MRSRVDELEFRIAISVGAIYFLIVLIVGAKVATGGNQLGDWGSWFAGTLTPGIILVAFYTFRTAERARLEQADAQRLMAEITERATFAAHRSAFEKQLSYFGSCVLSQKRMGYFEHPPLLDKGRGGFEWIWRALASCHDEKAEREHLEVLERLHDPKSKFFLDEFQKGLLDVMRVAYTARLYFQLDRRLQELPQLFTHFNLWQFDPHVRVRTKPSSFEDFFSSDIDPDVNQSSP
jgi:hypothetical protein